METLFPYLYKPQFSSSYPTYEEWKLFKKTGIASTDLSSYPTYEEWKLPNEVKESASSGEVLILPMRNGNEEIPKLLNEYKIKCLSYL